MHRRHRLGSASLIRRIYATGLRVPSRGATVSGLVADADEPKSAPQSAQAAPQAAPKIAVVASRKVGGAVDRNRARRRLRAAVGLVAPHMKPGSLAVVAATRQTRGLNFQKLVEDVRRTAEKAGLIREDGGISNA